MNYLIERSNEEVLELVTMGEEGKIKKFLEEQGVDVPLPTERNNPKVYSKGRFVYVIRLYPYYHENEITDELIEIQGKRHTHTRSLIVPGMKRNENLNRLRRKVKEYLCPDCKGFSSTKPITCEECGTELVPFVYGPYPISEVAEIEKW